MLIGDPMPLKDLLVVWFDPTNITVNYHQYETSTPIREMIHPNESFFEVNQLVDYLTDVDHEAVILIIFNLVDFALLSLIHDVPQLYRIYVLSKEKQIVNQWQKCRIICQTLESLFQVLNRDLQHIEPDHPPISVFSCADALKRDLNELPAAFLYSQILKEIALGLENSENSIEDLTHHLYEQNIDNEALLHKINHFQQNYTSQSVIYWYSKEDFLYRILNQSLRELNGTVVMKMAFFIRDLHQRIQQLSEEQTNHQRRSTVYRGQLMSNHEFNQLRHSAGGLLSFNSFLSTSRNQNVMVPFSDVGPRADVTGVCFEIAVSHNCLRTPFASVTYESHFQEEEEVLFSMHSVFRIDEVKESPDTHRWHVKLSSTSDDDEQLTALMKFVRNETKGPTGWHRLGQLMIRMGRWKEADEIYQELLKSTLPSNFIELSLLNNQLGYIWGHLGKHEEALAFYREALDITERNLPTDYLDRAKALNNMASVEASREHYSTALDLFKKALAMHRSSPLRIGRDLATIQENIGHIHNQMGNLHQASASFTEAQQIQLASLPEGHPAYATTLNNYGQLADNQGEYEQALRYYQQALQIQQRVLLPNHSDLAGTYSNIGDMQGKLGRFNEGLHSLEQAVRILKQLETPNYDMLALTYSNIGTLYFRSQDHQKALEFYIKASDIQTQHLPVNHTRTSKCYHNMAQAHKELGQFQQALECAEEALKIAQNIDPPIYRDQVQIYDCLGSIYYSIEYLPEALFHHQQALDIHNAHVRIDHADIARTYSNIGQVQWLLREFQDARRSFERARDIGSRCLPSGHPELLFYEANLRATER